MTEAGQIFALLRSASAAELAKRFNVVDDGVTPATTPQPATSESAVDPRGRGIGQSGTQAGQGARATLATVAATILPGSETEGLAPTLPDTLAPGQGGAVRPAVSLGHIAPPRSDLLRLLAEGLVSGTVKADGATSARAFPGSGGLGQAFGVGLGGLGLPAGASGGPTGPDRSMVPGTTAAADQSVSAGASQVSGAEKAQAAPRDAGQRAEAGTASRATDALAPGDEASTTGPADARAASAEARGAVAGRAGAVAQVAVFAEALLGLIAADGAGRSTSVASGVIFNAAMIPGWPFPTAFAKDGAEGINPKAMLHQLAAAIEGMSPEEAAAYMAKIGGGHAFLRNLRKLLKDLDLIEKDEVKGLLFAFLETISTIASGIQLAFRQMSESAALQEALVNGEDPDDGGRPGRRRLRL